MTIIHIPLTRNYVAIVDEADAHLVSANRWAAAIRRDRVYGQSVLGYMHRVITGATDGQLVDHTDGNGLNNRRSNLRITNAQGNCANTRKKPGESRFKGVHWAVGKWRVDFHIDGKRNILGLFESEIEAALTYDRLALAHHGEMARLNFPYGTAGVDDRLASEFLPSTIDPALAKKLRGLRLAAGMTQRQLAELDGVRRFQVMHWEMGRSPIPDRVWKLLEPRE